MFFRLESVEFADVVSDWWKLQEEIGIVTDLLSSLRQRNFVGNSLLNAATAIESYHRHRYPSQITTQQELRLERILKPFTGKDRSWLKGLLKRSHEPNYAARIDKVVSESGEFFTSQIGNARMWRDWVVAARNGAAHRDPSMINVDEDWVITVRVVASIQILMSIVLMKSIGVPAEVYEENIKRSGDFDFISRELRELVPEWFASQSTSPDGNP